MNQNYSKLEQALNQCVNDAISNEEVAQLTFARLSINNASLLYAKERKEELDIAAQENLDAG